MEGQYIQHDVVYLLFAMTLLIGSALASRHDGIASVFNYSTVRTELGFYDLIRNDNFSDVIRNDDQNDVISRYTRMDTLTTDRSM